MRHNAMWNAHNPNQGVYEKVLCICSAGLLRSPTTAWILSNHGYNTRAAGVHDYALIPVDAVLLHWAEHVLVMEKVHADMLSVSFPNYTGKVLNLSIPDSYQFRDKALVIIITNKLKEEGFIK